MKTPFLELLPTYRELQGELDAAYHRVMSSGWYLLGPELEAFESEFAAFCQARHAVGVGNGLDALHLVLRAYEIGPGDEVIVPAHTFIATWLAVSYAGATPVPVDVEPRFFNMDVSKVEALITPRTRAIMPVHLYGHPAEMEALMALAARHDLRVIEDAAQAHGSRLHGVSAGALGHAAGFSFYPGKNLGAFSDAGAVVTNDDALAAKVRKLRNYGSAVKYQHDEPGINSRIDELTAAVLRVKLSHLPAWNRRRVAVAARYAEALRERSDLRLPQVAEGCEHAWHLYAVRHPQRDRLREWLQANDVGSLIHYPVPPHLAPAYRALGHRAGEFPEAEEIAKTVLSLPMGPHLSSEQVDHVIAALRSYRASAWEETR